MTELRIALREGNQVLEEALRGMGIEPDPTFEKPPGWIEMEEVNFGEESISETGALVHDLEIVLQMLNDLQSTIEGQQATRDIESPPRSQSQSRLSKARSTAMSSWKTGVN